MLVNTSLTLLPHAEAADPVALVNSLQVDETRPEASWDLNHLLLHLATGPVLEIVVTSGDGEGLKAWHSLVARWDAKLRSRSAEILRELIRFDLAGDLFSKMAEYERAVKLRHQH